MDAFKFKLMVSIQSHRKDRVNLTDSQKELVLDGVANGLGNDKASQTLGISFRCFNDILIRDPTFAKEVARAREVWIHSLVYRLIGITEGCETMAEVSAAKVESENIKWAAGKFVPEVFGDNLNINVTHLDLSSVLLAAENRVIPILQAKTELVMDRLDARSSIVDDPRDDVLDVSEALGDIPPELVDLI